MKRHWSRMLIALMVAGATLLPAATTKAVTPREPAELAREVRKELITLPFLTIFDNLSYRVDGTTVYLEGQTIRPTIRTDAARRLMALPGVLAVVNHIEVLPLSPFDNQLRLAVARRVYGQPALNRYALGANPSIRIIVKNGNVTLEGVVSREMDRNIAGIQANGVSGVFSVTNNLRVVTG